MERDTLIESLEKQVRELEKQKEALAKVIEPFLDAEFARNICEWRDGDMQKMIAGEFREVIKAVKATGKKGKIAAVFTITPNKGAQVTINLDCKATVPKWGVDAAVAFADEDGALHRSDPAQMEMFEQHEKVRRNA